MSRRLKSTLIVLLIGALVFFCGCSNSSDALSSGTTVITDAPTTEQTLDISSYEGIWSDGELSWKSGGFLLELSIENDILTAYLQLNGSAPSSRIAEVTEHIALSAIDGTTISANFEDDNWGNSGTLTLELMDDKILCSLSNVTYTGEEGFALWGMYDYEVELVRNEDAHQDLTPTDEEYNEIYPEEEPTKQPAYDTTKASGILANAGLSEQEFRNICTPLTRHYYFLYNDSNNKNIGPQDRFHSAIGQQYYANHPEDPAVQEAISKWNDICADYQSGGEKYKKTTQVGMFSGQYHLFEKYGDLDTYLSDTVYCPKGYKISYENTQNLFRKMQEHPTEYLGKPFVLVGFDINPSANYTYTDNYADTTVTIRDLRDDAHITNIMKEYDYYVYVTFQGTSISGSNIVLHFDLLSLEKYST